MSTAVKTRPMLADRRIFEFFIFGLIIFISFMLATVLYNFSKAGNSFEAAVDQDNFYMLCDSNEKSPDDLSPADFS